jgi:hypothetical protein
MDTWQISNGARLNLFRTSSLEILKNIKNYYYKNDPKNHVVALDWSQT